ncbi:hypothetical protein HDA32_005494 [Spinactinospora alkalitolerans]|uniref:Uncharacterized protein n=1 Tax=Spinactinospora alkalitolerans TaxID=687207 RepID=A0A852U8G6_9ACTN|nr:hypothetical protein [Spinactinospora alkalitolerans]NYE50374.1 hypothetical protein [Spinactinospora alkalitolerans]
MNPHLLTTVGVLLALLATACGGGQDAPAAADAPIADGNDPSRPADSHTDSHDAPEAEEPETEEPETEEPEPAYTPPETVSLEGNGDAVEEVELHEDPRIATMTHDGSANFIVHGVNSSGEEDQFLANEIGSYEGTVLYNGHVGDEMAAVQVEADGAWTVELRPLTDARVWEGDEVSGTGHDVLLFAEESAGLQTVAATHAGEGNFAVWAYGEDSDLLVNEIGSYDGEVLMPTDTAVIAVEADGEWSMALD